MLLGFQAGGKSANPGEQLRVRKTDEQALMAAHESPAIARSSRFLDT